MILKRWKIIDTTSGEVYSRFYFRKNAERAIWEMNDLAGKYAPANFIFTRAIVREDVKIYKNLRGNQIRIWK